MQAKTSMSPNTTLAERTHDPVWATIRHQTKAEVKREPILASYLHATILNHSSLESALSFHMASKLASPSVPALTLHEVIEQAFESDSSIGEAIRSDIQAVQQRDSACSNLLVPFLYFKGFQALQAYRVTHWLWREGQRSLALYLQNQISVVFAVDIHPAARIGRGILLDHATGLVIGETAVVEDNVSIMQSVTLGGTGKETGDRHPKVRTGVLISAGAKILGNIEIGEGAMIAAGSVVLKPVKPHTIVAGVPATIVGKPNLDQPSLGMDHCCLDKGRLNKGCLD